MGRLVQLEGQVNVQMLCGSSAGRFAGGIDLHLRDILVARIVGAGGTKGHLGELGVEVSGDASFSVCLLSPDFVILSL